MSGFLKHVAVCAVVMLEITLLGCGGVPVSDDDSGSSGPNGTEATYLGSATCVACHSGLVTLHSQHGHSQALKRIEGRAPAYPVEADQAGVPNPPAGLSWFDISYVIGGYTKAANFIDASGYLVTDGTLGTLSQYNLENLINQTQPGFVSFLPDQTSPHPYEYDCFRCHTTGAESVDTNGGFRQSNLPGIGGTWAESGVQCEACHGPGSRHLVNPSAGNVVVDSSSDACSDCHGGSSGSNVLAAADGLLVGNQQSAEVAASPHSGFSCTVCHDPHVSVVYDPDNGLRNTCTDCHVHTNMAFHQDKIFVQVDYVERLSCQSCHMSPAGRNASSTLFGETPVGDTRSHLMYIDALPRTFASALTSDGQQLSTDTNGKAAVTVDVVCLRCHNGGGSAFSLSIEAASAIAEGMHEPP